MSAGPVLVTDAEKEIASLKREIAQLLEVVSAQTDYIAEQEQQIQKLREGIRDEQ